MTSVDHRSTSGGATTRSRLSVFWPLILPAILFGVKFLVTVLAQDACGAEVRVSLLRDIPRDLFWSLFSFDLWAFLLIARDKKRIRGGGLDAATTGMLTDDERKEILSIVLLLLLHLVGWVLASLYAVCNRPDWWSAIVLPLLVAGILIPLLLLAERRQDS